MSFMSMAIVSAQWFLFGYSFAFGPGTEGFGSFQWGALTNVFGSASGVYGWGIPHLVWVVFQCMFAAITPALISGAIVGRMRFISYVIFIFVWTTVVYDTLAHWMWSWTLDDTWTIVPAGWLMNLGGVGTGAIDFAGGTVIHISSGFSALAASLVVGRGATKQSPHNVPMVIIGTTLLWFGWFGFNAGSAAGAVAVIGGETSFASLAFLNTHLAAASAALSWMAVEKIAGAQPSAVGAACGAVAGLVAVTPACGFVMPWAAVVIGLIVSPVCFAMVKLKEKIGYDDTLDAFAIHGVGGIVGSLLTGAFADETLALAVPALKNGRANLVGYQAAAIAVSATFSFVVTALILLILKYSPLGLRISEEAESEGIDASEHGGAAYDQKKVEGTSFAGMVAANPKFD